MKIVVIGGTGLIGSKTVDRLRKRGHEVVAASPNTGVNTITGEGLAEAVAGASVVVDLANSASLDEKAALDFFGTSGRNLLAAEAAAGVKHHVALSVVGTERLQSGGYFRGKMLQENLIRASSIPYTIVHSTQFFDFMGAIASSSAVGSEVHVSPAYIRPIASDDVADAMAAFALGAPLNGVVEIGGPDLMRLNEGVERFLQAKGDPRRVVADVHAPYFGVELEELSLVPGDAVRFGSTGFDDWLNRAAVAA